MLETRLKINRRVWPAALALVVLLAAGAVQPRARALRGRTGSLIQHPDTPRVSLATELIGVKPGQTARLELKNKGDVALTAWLFFMDAQGKVLSERETTIQPGKTEAFDIHHPGGSHRVELRAQFGTESKTSISLLRPALRIVENASGKTVRLIGPERFKEAKHIPNPQN